MRLETTYLNLKLRSPLVVSALPMSQSIDNIKRMEEAGAGAVVLYSLFEEQVRNEQKISQYHRQNPKATSADAEKVFPARHRYARGLDGYLEHIRKAKEAVNIPIIASLNCKSLGSWTDFASQIAEAGADALELNFYHIPTNMDRTPEQIESTYMTMLKVVKSAVKIPVAVKLCPHFTNLSHTARKFDQNRADGLVLFNRFYQPNFDPKTLKLDTEIPLGRSGDARLPLHWIAILYGNIKADLAATSGIFTAEDIVKMLMVGANVTMLASVLLLKEIGYICTLEKNLLQWMDDNDYTSVDSLRGIMRQFHSKDASIFERSEYIQAITSYETPG